MTTTYNTNSQPDPLYVRAKQLLDASPGMGKGRLAKLLDIRTPTSRRLLERWRGQTQGSWNHPDYLRVEQLKVTQPGWGAVKVAQALSISLDHAKLHLARWVGVQDYRAANGSARTISPPPASSQPAPTEEIPGVNQIEDTTCGDARDISFRGSRIETVEGLLVAAKVDTHIWTLARHSVSIVERSAKDAVTGEPEPQRIISIRATLRRRAVELNIQSRLDAMLTKFREAAPVLPAIVRPVKNCGLLEISLPDLHLGKLAWAPEVGRAYDPDIAERMFEAALTDLLGKASIVTPERIVFIAGNDFLNVDGKNLETSNGTRQDESCRWPDSFARGQELMVRAITRLREVARVDVVMLQGNHDQQRLYYLGRVLAAWFRNATDVTVDASPRLRKYISYGKNLIGYCHGDGVSHDSLGMLMANEQPGAWSTSQHRAWGLGHFHSKKTKVYVPRVPFVPFTDSHAVAIRILPSLCPPDAWHYSMGYHAKAAAEAYFWDPEEGCTITFTHSPT